MLVLGEIIVYYDNTSAINILKNLVQHFIVLSTLTLIITLPGIWLSLKDLSWSLLKHINNLLIFSPNLFILLNWIP